MPRDAELFDQTERGEQLRMIEENFGEDLFVKQVQAPWPEPDEINQENRKRDHNDRNDCVEPFGNAF
jgi:hypothetical protein